jgi:hypothetical protein
MEGGRGRDRVERTTGKEKMETVTTMATENGRKEREAVEGNKECTHPV